MGSWKIGRLDGWKVEGWELEVCSNLEGGSKVPVRWVTGGEGSGAHEPERERRGILSTLSDVSLCEALLLPTDLLLAGGGAINPSVACDVPARWLLVLPWIWMVEDPLCGC